MIIKGCPLRLERDLWVTRGEFQYDRSVNIFQDLDWIVEEFSYKRETGQSNLTLTAVAAGGTCADRKQRQRKRDRPA